MSEVSSEDLMVERFGIRMPADTLSMEATQATVLMYPDPEAMSVDLRGILEAE